jgi:xanthine dehydrogenase YagS FAD-binding subunit
MFMQPFTFTNAASIEQAIGTLTGEASAKPLAGGTTLLDLMKLYVERPTRLVSITRAMPDSIEKIENTLRIGAGISNTACADHELIQKHLPAISESIRSGASGQIRNMATMGGNLLQRVRCPYFRDGISPCNKREPGSGCSMIEGLSRSAALLGTSEHCVATHPSDLCVALAALDASVRARGPNGERQIAFTDLYVDPGAHPERETTLARDELILWIDVPLVGDDYKQRYFKVRDRASYEFALASCCAVIQTRAGVITDARVALGGVATRPWRAEVAERTLVNGKPSRELFHAAARAALADAKPLKHNAFKVELCERVIVKTLQATAVG